jgi:hypothetical protein
MCSEELLVDEQLPRLRDDGLHSFPDAKEFAARLAEQVFVKKAIVEERTRT